MTRRKPRRSVPRPVALAEKAAPNRALAGALVVSTLALTALLAATKIGDPDTLQYLASGRLMLQRGLDYGCAFTYASDECQVAYSQWLFHLLAYGVYVWGGWNGLVIVQVLMAVGTVAVILASPEVRRCHPLLSCSVAFLAVMVARERFVLRADCLALLLAALLYVVLQAHGRGASSPTRLRGLLAAAAGIQLLWANTHGSFPLGLLIAGAFLGETLLAARLPDAPARGAALAAPGVVLAASLMNPFGLRAFLQPFRFVAAGKEMAPQLEFLSPFAAADFRQLTFSAYRLLLAVVVVTMVLSVRKLRPRDLLILAPLVYLSATAVRHMAFFAVLAALVLPRHLEELRGRVAPVLSAKTRRLSAAAAAVLLLAAMSGTAAAAITDELYRFDSISRRTGFGLSELVFPVAAADFVERAPVPGRMFNDYSTGTYLNWRFPARRTFIDGHSYTPETLAYYGRVMSRSAPFDAMAEKHRVDAFFLSHKAADTKALIAELQRSDRWPIVYFDELTMVFVRRTPENRALIDRYEVDLSRIQPTAAFANLRSPSDLFLGHTNRGLVYSGLGYDQQALAELRLAALANPKSFVALTALGIQLGKKGDVDGSIAACREAVRARPGYAPARFWLGIGHQRQARHREAIAELEKAISINPETRLAHFAIAQSREALGDRTAAAAQYREELALNPRHRGARQALARLGRGQGR